MQNLSQRLQELRKVLKKQKVHGFVVPSNDEFQSEFCPAHARRLEWLTGFSGSAGVAVVLEKKAAFFTDGRYTLQANTQVSTKDYEHYNISEKSPHLWVAENLKSGKLLLDPFLHSESNAQRYINVAKVELCKVNPIDGLWEKRPQEANSDIKIHPLKYSGQSSSEKIEEIAKQIQGQGADACVLAAPDSICWLLNIRANDVPNSPLLLAYAIIYSNKTVKLFVDKKRASEAVVKHLEKNVKITSCNRLKDEIKGLNKKKILIDPNVAPYWFFNNFNSKNIIRSTDPCVLPKACKNTVEVKGAYDAHVIDGVAVTKFLHWLESNVVKERITELSATRKLCNLRKESREFKENSFDTIAGFASNGAIVHYRSSEETNKELKGNGLFLVDSGGQYLQGTTDITRTIAIGKSSKEQKQNFTRVLKGHIALASAVFPKGVSGSQLDSLARQYLWAEGLEYDHGTGHGVGSYLNVHEGPQRISKAASNVALYPGMIISNEPGYYKEGEYGIRIENLVVVVKKPELSKNGREFYGFDTLTKAPIDMNLVDKALLNDAEKAWLTAYHKQVIKGLSPHLDKGTRDWLKKVGNIN